MHLQIYIDTILYDYKIKETQQLDKCCTKFIGFGFLFLSTILLSSKIMAVSYFCKQEAYTPSDFIWWSNSIAFIHTQIALLFLIIGMLLIFKEYIKKLYVQIIKRDVDM